MLSEGIGAISEVYGEEFTKVSNQLNEDLTSFTIEPDNLEESMKSLQEALERSIASADISKATKENINKFFEKLKPTADELKKMALKDQSLWKVYGDTLISAESLKTLTGSGNQMGNAVISGVNSSRNLSSAEAAGQAIKEAILKPFNESMAVTVPIKVQYRESSTDEFTDGGSAISVYDFGGLDGNATGTSFFGGGFTRINENGGEIIDLPTGSRIYPADKSAKMMNTPNININVIGNEEFAEEVGNCVCERIVDVVLT